MEDANGALVLRQHIGQAAIDHRPRRPAQLDPLVANPGVHLLARETWRTSPFACLVLLAFRFHATANAPGAVDRPPGWTRAMLEQPVGTDHGEADRDFENVAERMETFSAF